MHKSSHPSLLIRACAALASSSLLLGLLVLVVASSLAQDPIALDPAAQDPATPFDLRNGQWISESLLVGGQPDSEQLDAMQAEGIRSVINLRGTPEVEELAKEALDEAEYVASLGLPYLHIPISSADDLDADAARQLASWLDNEEHLPALVHCASGNRVGALFAFKAFHLDGQGVGEALRLGREHGMTSLYEAVAERLSEAATSNLPER